MAGWLEIRRGQAPVTNVNLVGRRVVVGRSPDCDVVLNTTSVSRQHAELICDNVGWRVRDLGSRNGTGVNGTRVAGERALQSGNVLRIDEFDLVFHAGPAPLRPAARPRTSVTDGAFGPARTLQELGPPKVDASHLSRLLGFSAALLAEGAADQRMFQLCELMTSAHFHGNAAVVLRILRSDASAPEILSGPTGSGGEPPISRSVIKAVLASDAPVLASSGPAGPKNNMVQMSVVFGGQATAAVACPIRGDGEHLDVLYVMLPGQYGTAEWLALASLASAMFRQAEDAWTAREAAQRQALLEEELRRAAAIQARLVPRDMSSGSLQIGFGFTPCKGVGGDYVDALPTRDGRVLVTVMDVAGKGIDAALIASGLHTTVHLAVRQGMSLPDLVHTLNRQLLDTWSGETFVTLAAALIDPKTGALEAVGCGHPAPMVVTPNGTIRELRLAEGMPIGLLDIELELSTDRLRPGELLLLYSDGLSECLMRRTRSSASTASPRWSPTSAAPPAASPTSSGSRPSSRTASPTIAAAPPPPTTSASPSPCTAPRRRGPRCSPRCRRARAMAPERRGPRCRRDAGAQGRWHLPGPGQSLRATTRRAVIDVRAARERRPRARPKPRSASGHHG
ncbi:SpoIIE family protein phosphatase [Nannocystis pusilla]|uniref:SpoIIE family protein phosphatase n=1 Tax=Nannocystis pusilla TaxID=889268 RepID=UPI003DA67C2C